MIFKQFYLESLGHASYLVGDEKTGEALVLDPRRDTGIYFDEARRNGLRITHGVDSHGHNDYLSGLSQLATDRHVSLLGLAGGHLGYDHREVRDGEVFEIGDVGFKVLHTPGHTPEHLSLVVYDRVAGDEPAMLLSGGSLLVGDLARPDLLGGDEAAREAARVFCHTIQEKLLTLPDHVEVFPTHVKGSLCGGNIGSRLSTTIGYERKSNAVLANVSSQEGFVGECIRLDNLPAVPPYWRRMRTQNLAGVALLGAVPEPPALQPAQFQDRASAGALVLDIRQAEAFAGGHIPGALNVGLGSSFSTWAGTVLPEGSDILLVLDRPDDLWEATWQLLRIGYSAPVGWLAGGMMAWRTSGAALDLLPTTTVHGLRDRLARDPLPVLDVRQPSEWAEGHIKGATFITGAELPSRLKDVPGGEVAVVCGSGYRSSAASSLLRREGHEVLNVTGGMSAWNNAGYATVPGDHQ
ncbi:MAG: MBL fold metallo-hydrolase [Candidatus Dormibacteria bacterium]